MTRIDPTKMEAAKEWADTVRHYDDTYSRDELAAAEVIAALPDTIVDGDKLQEVLDRWESCDAPETSPGVFIAMLKDLLPAQHRTMADIKWNDDEHLYMEAVTVSGRRYIMLAPMGKTAVSDNTILAAERGGGLPVLVPAEGLTPAGRYARMVWPDEHHPATDTEDVPAGERAMEEQTSVVDYGRIYHGDTERTHLPDETAVRRFVTDWEEV